MSAITFDRAKVLATCKTAKDRREWTELMDLIEAESARTEAAEAECARLRARLEAATERHWWVCTDWLRDGGRKKLGPFTTDRDALVARQYVERAEHTNKYFVDSDRAAGAS